MMQSKPSKRPLLREVLTHKCLDDSEFFFRPLSSKEEEEGISRSGSGVSSEGA